MPQALSKYWIELKIKREEWVLLSVCVLPLECSGRTFWNFRSGLFNTALGLVPIQIRVEEWLAGLNLN